MATVRRKPRIDAHAHELIRELAKDTWRSPAEILQLVQEAAEDEKDKVREAPDIRTVQRIVKDERPKDMSGPWSTFEALDDEAQIILPILRFVILDSGGRISSFTRAEAAAVLAVRRAAPRISNLRLVWLFAREYVRRDLRAETDFTALDVALADLNQTGSLTPAIRKLYEDGVIRPPFPYWILEENGSPPGWHVGPRPPSWWREPGEDNATQE
jgi:hypothetical protein